MARKAAPPPAPEEKAPQRFRLSRALEALRGVVGHLLDLGLVNHRGDALRVDEGHGHAPRRFFTHDHVARQQQADVGFGLHGLVGQRRVAGTEDAVGRHLHAELLFHRGLHVQVAQYAKALLLEGRGDAGNGFVERGVQCGVDADHVILQG
jgi:hypothetical protein